MTQVYEAFAAGRAVAVPGLDLELVRTVPFQPAPEAILLDPSRPFQPPAEEFRTLRTRLNHLQGRQSMQTVVVTSPSPAEGKSFVTANLALAQAQLAGSPALLCDFDFRRPSLHQLFQIERGPGLTDYLQGHVELHEAMRKIDGANLFVMPTGTAVLNPLELIHRPETAQMLDWLPAVFGWILLDTPSLQTASDASLLGTLCHATLLVARLGSTSADSIDHAVRSLCRNNVVGIVANAAR
jgi:capsular exopolysaccharide synthesis family protein